MPKKARKRVKTCRTKGCGRPARSLGVCDSCYSVVYRAVQKGEITWDEAESRGLVERTRRPAKIRKQMERLRCEQ